MARASATAGRLRLTAVPGAAHYPQMLRTALVTIAALLAAASVQGPRVDLLIHNARIYTGVPASPWAAAIAISGDRIVSVGANAELQRLPAVRTIDAAGRLVIPGINDAHTHPGASPLHTALEGPAAMMNDPSWTEILERVTAAAAKAPPGGWIVGEIGGRVLEDPKATRPALDQLTGGRPLMLGAWHGHGVLFNTAALRALKVSETEPDPAGGFFVRMPDGKTLTGLAHEYAAYALVRRFSMLAGPEAAMAAYQGFAKRAASFGITSVQAMMTSYPADQAAPLFARATLPIRVRLIAFPIENPNELGCRSPTPLVTCGGVKYIVDGTPIERLMFLREPYDDAADTRGRLNFAEPRLWPAITISARLQPMFHTVGDAAIDAVLRALEQRSWLTVDRIADPGPGGRGSRTTSREHHPEGTASLRPRLEHADMMEPGHFASAKTFGIVVVQNPSHFMIADTVRARIGGRIKRTAMVKSILRAGIPFALGSDGPLNPYQNIMFATMNPTNPAEALTVREALDAYTRGSAYAEMMEKEKGTLAPGMLADLAILSQDIFEIPTTVLPGTTSVLTVVGGRVVHEVK